MCEHCGCRQFPVVGRLSEEHLRIHEVSGRLRRAIRVGDDAAARRWLGELTDLLAPHVATEESGLFAELRGDEVAREFVERLCDDHDDLATALRQPDGERPDWTAVLAGLDQLQDHIDKEEYGVFPAAVILLSMPAWERITAAAPGTVSTRTTGTAST